MKSHVEFVMNKPNIALYAGDSLGESQIVNNLAATRQVGWTTVILGLFHIGYPPDWPEAKIFFNDTGVIDGGKYLGDFSWPNNIAQLKQNDSSVTQIYASFGGGPPVEDFTTIHKIYESNNHTFHGTLLEKNLEVFRKTFPTIDGIDMDCEDYYDPESDGHNSFAAFCELLIELGFDITFCPYDYGQVGFWVNMLRRIQVNYSNRVKWWNLQCYDGGDRNNPELWANAIKEAGSESVTDGFILAGDWNRFYDTNVNAWRGRCPEAVKEHIAPFKQQACVGGGFIWQMDTILNPGGNFSESGCANKKIGMSDYFEAIR
jgi:hypothetical protein